MSTSFKDKQVKKSKSKEYKTWCGMKQRCYNPNASGYKYYGEKGIRVCDRWLESFENFILDMGFSPTKDHSIDRINSDGHYCPENCRWVTIDIQQKNRKFENDFQREYRIKSEIKDKHWDILLKHLKHLYDSSDEFRLAYDETIGKI